MVRHLEAVLRQNLADFVGIQEVEGLLQRWGQTEENKALIRKAIPDWLSRLRFARLLRALVEEQVPITSWRKILACVEATGLDNLEEAVRAVRLRLKEELPGNDSKTQRLEVPAEWKDAFESCLENTADASSPAQPAEQAYRVRARLQNFLQSADTNVALVVDKAEIRPQARRFLQSWFPNLMVLSREEVLSHDVHAAD